MKLWLILRFLLQISNVSGEGNPETRHWSHCALPYNGHAWSSWFQDILRCYFQTLSLGLNLRMLILVLKLDVSVHFGVSDRKTNMINVS